VSRERNGGKCPRGRISEGSGHGGEHESEGKDVREDKRKKKLFGGKQNDSRKTLNSSLLLRNAVFKRSRGGVVKTCGTETF